ncbi:hypothetical protein [Legionella israelensis]|uniref:Uncharacterized protein n=1 Tax=Legionella israelensis TaxID=454 RepID=Q49J15_9GAMM|nr:hypothetical protein [Legionella israelensis]AAX56261.1 unknown [Legionella israelensis]KTD28723.1 hypothetical protein Lisr_0865 [Legionella israelensis]QBS09386.1 hypothetical protein E4T55_05660 [Legionella israelensis]SCX88688.1 hypothetical protein SAMN02746069_00559 [Legionella israelensis DSM 19235]STX60287.1 Uncharacterised protein [Legionella israelensis]
MKGNLPDESEKKTDLASNRSSFFGDFKSRLEDVKSGHSVKEYVQNKVIPGLQSAEKDIEKIIGAQLKSPMGGASKANEDGAGQIKKGIEDLGNILENVFTRKHTHTS